MRWDRAVLVIFSIALGVATLVSTRILNKCLEDAAHDTMTPIPVADLYVAQGEIGVQRELADEIQEAEVPGVELVMPMIFEQVRLTDIGGDGGRIGMLVGVNMSELKGLDGDGKKSLTPHFLNFSAALSKTGIFISEYLYRERQAAGLGDNDPVKVRYADKEVSYPLSGYLEVDTSGKAASFERNLVVLDLKPAISLTQAQFPEAAGFVSGAVLPALDALMGERVSRIDIHLQPGANRDEVQRTIKVLVGNRADVKTLEEQKKSTDDVIAGIQISFNLCSLGAMVVGLFLVYNSLSVSVAERRHDIGILRSLGATRLQVARLFAGEATLLGLVGALFGIPLGIKLADTAIFMFQSDLNDMFLNPDIRASRLSSLTWTMVAAAVAGVLTALLAALVPAIQASHDEPADAVRRAPSAYSGFFRRLHRLACLALIGSGIGMVLLRTFMAQQRIGSFAGLVLILVGMFLSLPILVGWTTRVLQLIFRSLLGIEARLAADNLIRSPARTGVVIGALAAGVSLMFQTAGVGKSNEVPVKQWIDQVIQADAFVFAGSLTSANSSLAPMKPGIGKLIQEKVPEVERVVGLRFLRPEFRDTVICLVAIDAQDYSEGTRARLPVGLPGLERFGGLAGGDNIVVSDNFAMKFGIREGDVITLPRRKHGPIELKVIGIGQDYTWSKGTIFMDRRRYADAFEDPLVDIYHVYYKSGVDPAQARQTLENVVAPYKLVVEERPFVREFLAGIIDKIYRLAYLQQFVVAVVAALGVITALLISVLQRRRELGLLRAVGATQPQVLKSVLAEAFLMGIIGTILGIALGVPMEWYLLRVVILEESGFWFDMIIPWKEALGISAVAIVVATLAGLLPALHAVRLRIVDAIAYE